MGKRLVAFGAVYILYLSPWLYLYGLAGVAVAFVPGVSYAGLQIVGYFQAAMVVVGVVCEVLSHPARKELKEALRGR